MGPTNTTSLLARQVSIGYKQSMCSSKKCVQKIPHLLGLCLLLENIVHFYSGEVHLRYPGKTPRTTQGPKERAGLRLPPVK